jgi:hypothetical protein
MGLAVTGRAVDSFGVHTERSVAELAAGGVSCALRYHYNLTGAEVQRLHAAGISVCLIAEFDTSTWHPPLHSPDSGGQHASRAVAVARSLGFPRGCVVWLTADTFVGPAAFETAGRYWALARSVLSDAGYRTGAYGGSLLIDWLHDRGLADVTWEAGARSWSSATGSVADYRPSRTASLRQLVAQHTFGGVTCDLNDVLADGLGDWRPDGAASTGPAHQEDFDVPEPVYRFADPNQHPSWGHDAIVLLCGPYTLEDGREGTGWHWLHLDDITFAVGLDEHKFDDNPPDVARYRFAAGNDALDKRFAVLPHVFTRPATFPPAAPPEATPTPAPQTSVEAVLKALGEILSRMEFGDVRT